MFYVCALMDLFTDAADITGHEAIFADRENFQGLNNLISIWLKNIGL